MALNKQDLEGTHYSWHTGSHKQLFSGQPSRRIFDRYNGDQVLFLINYYCNLTGQSNITDIRRIEYDIIHHLPENIKSEVSVFHWISSRHLHGSELR